MPGAGIFGNLLAQQPRTPESFIADRQANEASGLTNALSAAKLDEYQQGLLRDSKLRNMLASGAGSDQLIQGGFLKEGMDLSKNKADVGNINSQEASHRVKAFADKAAVMRSSIGSVPNPQAAARYMQQAFADPDMGPVMKQFGTLEEALSEIPNDPNGFRNWQMQASEGIGKLADHAMKQQEFGLKQNQFGETVRHNKSTEGIQIRGQNLVDARAKDGNTLKAAEIQAGGKPPPGYRWNPDGSLTAIPGGPGDKLPESQQKQVVGVQNLSNAIQEYRQALKSFGMLDALNPDQRAMMGTKYNNMMLQAKEAYNLGVLNRPDFDILQSVVTDPRSLKGVITSNKALDTQASELDRIMSGVAQTSSQLKPRGGATQPSNQGPKAGDVDGGYRFKGGDPSNPSNWEKVK